MLLAAACVLLQLVALDRRPAVWFDEGFRFNAGRLLADTGTFGSRSAEGIIPFDQALTSGPVEVEMVALSFKSLGIGVAQGRLPFVLLTAASLLLIWHLGARAFDVRTGSLMALTVAAAPPVGGVGLMWLGRQALSETPALAMVLLGLCMWLRSHRRRSGVAALAAGLAFGLAVLSKAQFGLALAPAVGLVAAARWRLGLDPAWRAAVPLAGAALAVGGWSLLGRLLTPPSLQQQNLQMLNLGIEANIVTGLWGATLGRAAIALALGCTVAAAWGGWRALREYRRDPAGDAAWLLATLSLLTLFNTAWFTFFSIGWPRYAYLGAICALMLGGVAVADASAAFSRVADRARRGAGRLLAPLPIAALMVLAAGNALTPALSGQGSDAAARMSGFIDGQVDRDAVIETWEWELSGLGVHTAFHFPSQRYVYLSTYQQGRRLPFDLPYDPLAADPDFLITGPFSALTGIYRRAIIDAQFAPRAEFGPYTIYARRR
jgi:4-amino-4-deoxy-L-arabinose transferase-like glycosyltransferase